MENRINEYKCPCCGAPLIFDAAEQNLHCESCENDFSAETMQQLDEADGAVKAESKYDWENYTPRNFEDDGGIKLSGYSCPSCGAEVTGDDNLGATVCPYCGNSTIIKKQFEGTLRPDYVIPFKVDKKSAVNFFEEACKKAPFLPDEYRDKRKIEEMAGIYVPFWTFDCKCGAVIDYRGERISTWSDRDYIYTKTSYYRMLREGNIEYRNIPVDGSEKIDNTYMESLEPYFYDDAVEFNTAYLSGFIADKYDIAADECIPRANDRIKNSTSEAFDRTVVGYSSVRQTNSSFRFSDSKVRYALLPVWMFNVQYGGINYKYSINGQTGKVAGKFPICKKKRNIYFAKIFGISLAITAVIAALIFYYS